MTTLTMQDEKRLAIIQRVFRGELTVDSAAALLGITERQFYRIKRRGKREGQRGPEYFLDPDRRDAEFS